MAKSSVCEWRIVHEQNRANDGFMNTEQTETELTDASEAGKSREYMTHSFMSIVELNSRVDFMSRAEQISRADYMREE